jgi:hypothetical protein
MQEWAKIRGDRRHMFWDDFGVNRERNLQRNGLWRGGSSLLRRKFSKGLV